MFWKKLILLKRKFHFCKSLALSLRLLIVPNVARHSRSVPKSVSTSFFGALALGDQGSQSWSTLSFTARTSPSVSLWSLCTASYKAGSTPLVNFLFSCLFLSLIEKVYNTLWKCCQNTISPKLSNLKRCFDRIFTPYNAMCSMSRLVCHMPFDRFFSDWRIWPGEWCSWDWQAVEFCNSGKIFQDF